jgi:hypothetical protein
MSLIPIPTIPPAPASFEFALHPIVGANTNPFTGQQQIQDWQASYMEASVSLPPMYEAEAQAWITFLESLRGITNTFQFPDELVAAYPESLMDNASSPPSARTWRLLNNDSHWTIKEARLYGITFEIREVGSDTVGPPPPPPPPTSPPETTTITSAVLSIVTAYDPGANPELLKPAANISLWDMREWPQITADWLEHGFVVNAQDAWAKRTDTVDLVPYPSLAKSGPGPYSYLPGSRASTLAYDDSSLTALLDSLVVSLYAWTSQIIYPAGSTDGTATANLNVYGAYLDVTFEDGSTQRYWAQTTTVIAAGSGCGTPTGVSDAGNAVDRDLDTSADVQETNAYNGIISPLWQPAVLVLSGWAV